MAEIVWAPNALDDVEKLIAYIGGDSIVRAQRFAARLINRVESLGTQPESGSWLPEDERHVYRQIFHGAWRVFIAMTQRPSGSLRSIIQHACWI